MSAAPTTSGLPTRDHPPLSAGPSSYRGDARVHTDEVVASAGWATPMGSAVERHDVLVIGGGVYGASIAYHLSARRVECALVEMHGLASGPTGRSSAVVRVHYSIPELAELARRGLDFFSDARDILGRARLGAERRPLRLGRPAGLLLRETRWRQQRPRR